VRQNLSMRHPDRPVRRLKSWLFAAVMALTGAGCVAVADGIACDQYVKRVLSQEPGGNPQRPQEAAARLLDGELCRGAECSPAILVQGVLSDETSAAILERATAVLSGDLWVCLDSPGGAHSVSAIGPLPPHVKTCVTDIVDQPGKEPRAGLCASACAWLWLAGADRVIFGRNQVGFHRSYIHDSTVCAPGNAVKAAEGLALGWLRDHLEHGYDAPMHAARHDLRWAGLAMGPTEAYYVNADHARAAGLQTAERASAVFHLTADSAEVATR